MDETSVPLLRAAQIDEKSQVFHHPWNPKSEVSGLALGRELGLRRTGVNLCRVPPGKESFIAHSHQLEEEWIYVLAGQGQALLGDDWIDVRPGDFMAFPTPSIVHHMRNCGEVELEYLTGGEHREFEVADFPTVARRMVRVGNQVTTYGSAEGRPFETIDPPPRP